MGGWTLSSALLHLSLAAAFFSSLGAGDSGVSQPESAGMAGIGVGAMRHSRYTVRSRDIMCLRCNIIAGPKDKDIITTIQWMQK